MVCGYLYLAQLYMLIGSLGRQIHSFFETFMVFNSHMSISFKSDFYIRYEEQGSIYMATFL